MPATTSSFIVEEDDEEQKVYLTAKFLDIVISDPQACESFIESFIDSFIGGGENNNNSNSKAPMGTDDDEIKAVKTSIIDNNNYPIPLYQISLK